MYIERGRVCVIAYARMACICCACFDCFLMSGGETSCTAVHCSPNKVRSRPLSTTQHAGSSRLLCFVIIPPCA